MHVRMRTFSAWSSCQACTDANFWRLEFMSYMCRCELLAHRVHVMHVRIRTFGAQSSCHACANVNFWCVEFAIKSAVASCVVFRVAKRHAHEGVSASVAQPIARKNAVCAQRIGRRAGRIGAADSPRTKKAPIIYYLPNLALIAFKFSSLYSKLPAPYEQLPPSSLAKADNDHNLSSYSTCLSLAITT